MKKLIWFFMVSCLGFWASLGYTLELTGTITNYRGMNKGLALDLKLGQAGESVFYTVQGKTSSMMNLTETRIDFSGIQVHKNSTSHDTKKEISNKGVMVLSSLYRDAYDLEFVGVQIQGKSMNTPIGLQFLPELLVVNEPSSGHLKYNWINGHYDSDLGIQFGNTLITSTKNAGTSLMNYDDSILTKMSTLNVDLFFGDLEVRGDIQFSDSVIDIAKNETETPLFVTGTTGKVNLNIKKKDGTGLILSRELDEVSADEAELKKLLAFFEYLAIGLITK